MAIPKKIHYCWFGGNPLPKLAKKCIKSWKKYCPDYKIIEWNENNFDIASAPLYVRQAYEAKKWAFVTDYVRLKIVFEEGGVYFDTDVQVLKNIDCLLKDKGFFGFEYEKCISTGLGFGAEKGNELILEMMADYEEIPFLLDDGSFDLMSCPDRNTHVLIKYGLLQNNQLQVVNGCTIYPSDYFSPKSYVTGKIKKTKNTLTIHHFSESWVSKDSKQKVKEYKKKIKKANCKHFWKILPNRILIFLLGQKNYEKLKFKLKK